MPIIEPEPWRLQFFDGVPCPEHVRIPTDDGDAWAWNPRHRWVYDKLAVAESQGIACGPHGLEPPCFPVFSKPVFNIRGMGAGSRLLRNRREYLANRRPGHIWMPLLAGEHLSTDFAVVAGEAMWWRHAVGVPLDDGMFDHWVVLAGDRPEIAAVCTAWIRRNLVGYTGMVNLETIGSSIIDVHLRFADQWPDLYGGRRWVEALVRLYSEGRWEFAEPERRDGWSVVLFGAHGVRYRHPPPEPLAELRAMPGILSIQITFHEDRPPSWHSMPPGGFRLAIVNAFDREAAERARERLAVGFWSTQQLAAPGRRNRVARAAKPANLP